MSENNFGEELGKLPPDLTLGATSDQIIRRGRRIRTFRQTSIVGAAAVAVLGITSVAALASGGHHGAQTVHTGSGGSGQGLGIALAPPASPTSAPAASSTSSAPVSPSSVSVGSGSAPPPASGAASSASPTQPASSLPASSSASVSCTASPAPQSTDGAPAASPDGNAPPWGTLVQAGKDVGTTTSIVLYGVHIDDSAIPCTHFGLMVGTVDTSGTVTGAYEGNEFDGSDLTPGFHAVSMVGKEFAGTYFVGYYVGPASTITAVVNGASTPAHVAAWSVNPDVKFWWLGGSADGNPVLGALTAKDAKGNVLPVGTHAQLGVG
jgi:hypothetical protein